MKKQAVFLSNSKQATMQWKKQKTIGDLAMLHLFGHFRDFGFYTERHGESLEPFKKLNDLF